MIDKFTAETQARLSYLVLIGYFGLKVLEGMKLITPVSGLNEFALVVLYFWFQRSRPQETKPNA